MKKINRKICFILSAVILGTLILAFSPGKASAATIELPYEVSEAYGNSVYYTNLLSVQLTGDERTDIINVAFSQLGYHEGSKEGETSGYSFDGKGNVSEASYWFGTQIKGQKTGFNYSWCAMFVSWCARMAGISEDVISNATYACPAEKQYFFQNLTYHPNDGMYTPQAGDLVFFKWESSSSAWDHVELVTDCAAGYLFTIGGNARNSVAAHAFDMSESCIKGFGEPQYTVTPSEHNYSEWETVLEPTCTAKGIKQRICTDCNLVDTADISPLGHQFYHWGNEEDEWIIDSEPTCISNGERSFHCIRCGTKSNSENIPALGHDYSDGWTITAEPTCTEKGEKALCCSVCGEKGLTKEIEPLGHTFSDEWTVDVEPQCETEGEKSHHCIACDERTDITPVEPIGHKLILDSVTEPTCTEEGTEHYICSNDPSHTNDIPIPLIEHTPSEWTIREEPSYARDGEKYRYCTVCSTELETESIPMLTESNKPYGFIAAGDYEWHSLVKNPAGNIYFNTSVSITVSAFDDESGIASIMCIASEKILSEEELVLSEKWTEGTGLRLNKDGIYLIYAKITDVSGNVIYISTDFIEVDMTAPTSNGIVDGGEYCKEAIFTAEDKNLLYVRVNGMPLSKSDNGTYRISASPFAQKVEIIDAAGNLRTFTIKVNEDHIFSEYIINRAPTCTETGVRHRECTVCGEVHYETISEYGHDYSDNWTAITEASCTSTGTEARVCSRCGKLMDERSVSALGHEYVNGKCIVCGKESSDTIPYEAIVAAVIFVAIAAGVFIWERRKNRYV